MTDNFVEDYESSPQKLEDMAFEVIVLTQIAEADPAFWEKWANTLLNRKKFISDANSMPFDVQIFFPKVEQLRNEGKISSVSEAREAARRVVTLSKGREEMIHGQAEHLAIEILPNDIET